jgi:hypothetical protein
MLVDSAKIGTGAEVSEEEKMRRERRGSPAPRASRL